MASSFRPSSCTDLYVYIYIYIIVISVSIKEIKGDEFDPFKKGIRSYFDTIGSGISLS